LEIVSFGVSSIKADEEDEKMLKQMQKDAAYTNGALANATLTSAVAQGIKDAANNPGGAMNGFVGVNMAAGAANILGGLNQQQPAAPAAPVNGWTCPKCGKVSDGAFCPNCGTPKPEKWICPKCGKENDGKFCSNCGTEKPAPAVKWICPKCGKENDGKFCSNCGTGMPE
ncbi:MAG: SPFH domain-containing protein, partial [Solobacterium sp.]|nr:SPFH domain-containing protein [Solobacterium sp.]